MSKLVHIDKGCPLSRDFTEDLLNRGLITALSTDITCRECMFSQSLRLGKIIDQAQAEMNALLRRAGTEPEKEGKIQDVEEQP